MFVTTWTLEPVKIQTAAGEDNCEQVIIRDEEGYPSALTHVDLFWRGYPGADQTIHERLSAGETVTVERRRDRHGRGAADGQGRVRR